MSKMNPVVHFEMPAENRKRMAEFYTNVFGWKIQQLGPEMGEYMLVTTSDTDEKGFPLKPGMIGGGFYQKTDDPLTQHPSVVISVNDINESIKKVKSGGGKVLGEPMPIPGVGTFVSFIDTEGNRVSILQPQENM
jgi:predicted enzyme related to lactoylglutathione lyase